MRTLPDDLTLLALYGQLGSWDAVAKHISFSKSAVKNKMSVFLAGHGYRNAAQAIWYEFGNMVNNTPAYGREE